MELPLKFALAAAVLIAFTAPSFAASKAEQLAQFEDYIAKCTEDPGDRTVDRCIEDQVDSVDHYLGDIVGEMTGYVSEKAGKIMLEGQKAFEAHRRLTCSSEMEMHPEEPYAGLFCFHRLTSQRVEDVQEGLTFSTLKLED